MSLCRSLLVFPRLSRTDFHGFLLYLRHSAVVVCALLPPAREGAGGERRIVGFEVISENPSTVCVGRDLEDHLSPPPCHGQGHLPLSQVTPSPVQPGLGHFQGWGSHCFSGQPVPGPQHPHSQEFLPKSNLNLFHLKAIPLCACHNLPLQNVPGKLCFVSRSDFGKYFTMDFSTK